MKPTTLEKIAIFSDIHFGRRSNSKIHNQDCLDYVSWFCAQVRGQGYTHIAFLGDWFESRSAINIETIEYSYLALQQLNQLGLPIFFCVGNHDLHRRTTRDVHSVRMFNELTNFQVIDHPILIDGCLFSPFLFEEEYAQMIEHNDCWAFFGHFEFKNFILTGQSRASDHGTDHTLFKGPKRIFSGHFHKRQVVDNVVYIGNTFPMDFGDAGDYDRGMCTYYVNDDKVTFTNWSDAPKYYRTTISKIMDNGWTPLPKMKVKCTIDIDIGYQDAQDLREGMIAAHGLRDFILEEDRESKQDALSNNGDNEIEASSIDEFVIKQLQAATSDKLNINVPTLISIYQDLPVEITESTE